MATEKFFVFNEAGTLKRLKGRIVRFLDNEDPSGSDKSAIRTSLEVSPDAEGLVQADVGTGPNEIPVNGMLGDLAYQSADSVSVGTLEADGVATLTNTGDNALRVESTDGNPMYVNVVGTAQNYLFDVRDDGTSKFRVDGSGRVGIGGSPSSNLHVYSSTADNLRLERDATNDWRIQLTGGALAFRDATADAERWRIDSSGNLVANSTGIDFGSGDILDTYEEGTFTPQVADADTGGNVATAGSANGWYTRVGNLVHVALRVTNINTTGLTASNRVRIRNLPFDFEGTTFTPGSVIVDNVSFTGMIAPTNVGGVTDNILVLTNFSGAADSYVAISALTSGSADIYLNMSYLTDEA